MESGENMNKRKTRMVAIGLSLSFVVCALSVGILASMNGFFAFYDGNDPAVYADPNVLDFRVNEPQVHANPDSLPHRTNTPSGMADAYASLELSKYEEFGEIPIEKIIGVVAFP